MIPREWSYEAMEAWYPGTIWNPNKKKIILYSDWEPYDGRSSYASIGGCYYAARLAVGELLIEERRQASVIILREAHPGYLMPVGVWQVRENVRNAVNIKALKFNRFVDVLDHVNKRLMIPVKKWINSSVLLKNQIFQRRITDYV